MNRTEKKLVAPGISDPQDGPIETGNLQDPSPWRLVQGRDFVSIKVDTHKKFPPKLLIEAYVAKKKPDAEGYECVKRIFPATLSEKHKGSGIYRLNVAFHGYLAKRFPPSFTVVHAAAAGGGNHAYSIQARKPKGWCEISYSLGFGPGAELIRQSRHEVKCEMCQQGDTMEVVLTPVWNTDPFISRILFTSPRDWPLEKTVMRHINGYDLDLADYDDPETQADGTKSHNYWIATSTLRRVTFTFRKGAPDAADFVRPHFALQGNTREEFTLTLFEVPIDERS